MNINYYLNKVPRFIANEYHFNRFVYRDNDILSNSAANQP